MFREFRADRPVPGATPIECAGATVELHRRPPYAHGVFEELFKALLHKLMTGEVGMRELDLGAFGGHTC